MRISLKQKKLKNGTISLYIESYKGTSTDEDGKRIHLRDLKSTCLKTQSQRLKRMKIRKT
jgi:hypothetical protein